MNDTGWSRNGRLLAARCRRETQLGEEVDSNCQTGTYRTASSRWSRRYADDAYRRESDRVTAPADIIDAKPETQCGALGGHCEPQDPSIGSCGRRMHLCPLSSSLLIRPYPFQPFNPTTSYRSLPMLPCAHSAVQNRGERLAPARAVEACSGAGKRTPAPKMCSTFSSGFRDKTGPSS